ncbi:hypothetical protein EV701_117156 [Chthoniobacter flavus]|nr:hypothetical protein EV701_117156 [Chthoniobacter flavus]
MMMAGRFVEENLKKAKDRLLCAAIGVLALLGSTEKSHAQAFGPPNICYNGQLYAYSFTADDPVNPGVSYDYYYTFDGQNQIDIDQSYNVAGWGSTSYDPGSQTFNGTTALVAVGSDRRSFLGISPGLLIYSNNGIGQIYDGATWHNPDYYFIDANGVNVAQFETIPGSSIFQVGASPYYIYNGPMTLDDSNGTWPASNIFTNAPPQVVYVLAQGDSAATVFSLGGTNVSAGNGYYNEELDYHDQSGGYNLTIHRYYNMGSYSGDVAGVVDGSNSFTGLFDPVSQQFSYLSTESIQISLSSITVQTGQHGPPYISWGGLLLSYTSTDSSDTDHYADAANTAAVAINSGSAVSGSGPSGYVSGVYNSTTQTFNVYAGNFFAMDANRNPIGLPPGLNIVVGYPGFAQDILLSNNTDTFIKSVDYSYQRTDGNWVNEYVNVPTNYWYLVADDTGNYTSQIYVTTDTATTSNTIDAVAGWPISNAYPPHIYLNTADCVLHWETQAVYSFGSSPPASGSVNYYTTGNSVSLGLNWNWDNGVVTWTWYANGYGGYWDGVSTFWGQPDSVRIALTPPTSPLYGPAQLYWNGTPLNYDGNASLAANADAYTGGGIRIQIDSAGNVSVFVGNSNIASYTGSYDAASHLFNLGTGNFGTISGWDSSGHVLGTTASNGNMDIPGNVLSLGSWQNGSGESVNGLFLSFTPPSSSVSDAEVRFGSTIALTDWIWSRAVTDGSTSHMSAMQLDANNRLLLFAPTDDSTPKVVLDPVNGSSFNGPLRVMQRGDVSMGIFQNGPQPQ